MKGERWQVKFVIGNLFRRLPDHSACSSVIYFYRALLLAIGYLAITNRTGLSKIKLFWSNIRCSVSVLVGWFGQDSGVWKEWIRLCPV